MVNELHKHTRKHSPKTAVPYFAEEKAGDRALLELRTVPCASVLPKPKRIFLVGWPIISMIRFCSLSSLKVGGVIQQPIIVGFSLKLVSGKQIRKRRYSGLKPIFAIFNTNYSDVNPSHKTAPSKFPGIPKARHLRTPVPIGSGPNASAARNQAIKGTRESSDLDCRRFIIRWPSQRTRNVAPNVGFPTPSSLRVILRASSIRSRFTNNISSTNVLAKVVNVLTHQALLKLRRPPRLSPGAAMGHPFGSRCC